jgi:hypothetical protein
MRHQIIDKLFEIAFLLELTFDVNINVRGSA